MATIDLSTDEIAQLPAFLRSLYAGQSDSGGAPPIDSSMAGDPDSSYMPPSDSCGSTGAAMDTGQPAAPPDTKLSTLQQILAGQHESQQAPDVQPDLSVGQNPYTASAGTRDLGQSMTQNQPTIDPTFRERHPGLFKVLNAATEFAMDAGPGVGAHTFGEGF